MQNFSGFILRVVLEHDCRHQLLGECVQMFERMFHEGRDYAWTMDAVVETPERAAAEWTFGYVVGAAVPRSAGRKVRFRGMSLFELSGGKIAAYREYFDEGQALLQLGFAPDSLAKVLRRKLVGP